MYFHKYFIITIYNGTYYLFKRKNNEFFRLHILEGRELPDPRAFCLPTHALLNLYNIYYVYEKQFITRSK